MKKLIAILILGLGLSVNAVARTAVIENIDNQTILSMLEKKLSKDQVKKAILKAGLSKGWSITPVDDNKLLGTLVVRNKHTIKVSIPYSTSGYSLMYADSDNMLYDAENNTIHRNYNRWVRNLESAINMQLSQQQ